MTRTQNKHKQEWIDFLSSQMPVSFEQLVEYERERYVQNYPDGEQFGFNQYLARVVSYSSAIAQLAPRVSKFIDHMNLIPQHEFDMTVQFETNDLFGFESVLEKLANLCDFFALFLQQNGIGLDGKPPFSVKIFQTVGVLIEQAVALPDNEQIKEALREISPYIKQLDVYKTALNNFHSQTVSQPQAQQPAPQN